METFQRLRPYLRPHRVRLAQACLAMLGVAGLNGAMVFLVKPAIDIMFQQKDAAMLMDVVLAIPIVLGLKMVVTYIQSYLMSYLGQKITQKIREDLFQHLHRLSMDFYWKSKSGEVLSRLTNDLTRLQDGLHFVPLYLVRDTFTVLVVLGAMFYIHWRFALTALIAVPLSGIVLAVLGRKLRAASRRSQEIMGEIYHRFQESLQGMLVVKAFNYEHGAIARFQEENDSLSQQMMRYFRATALSGPLMEFLGSLIMAAIVYQGGKEVVGGRMTPGDFFAFLTAFFAAYAPIKNLSQLNATLQMALSAADRIFAILDEKPTVQEKPGAALFGGLKKGIVFENVSFRYPGREALALKNVSFEIRPGEVFAFAGPSGSGKTTLAHLLLRLFDPSEGRILVDGRDLREYSMASLRQGIGLVTQDTVLFNDTVKGNIILGKPDAGQDELVAALRVADAESFVSRMPQGLFTPLGDRGLQLSGGQRQRLAIARAVLKNPTVMILDEATSNLDSASERSVQEALERIFPGRTVLMIAHRLSTLKSADRVFVLHQGEIKESGSHQELLRLGGLYAALYQFQELQPSAEAAAPGPR
ncbi:MAG: ABC transporter ATP-binding protein [Elusimicrobia bacterium]|nr:ABC transporter ATP-binding protein [Elusimicrobiota bacterium]